jgi:hypothetical protein
MLMWTTKRGVFGGALSALLLLFVQSASAVPSSMQFLEFTEPLDTPTGFNPVGFPATIDHVIVPQPGGLPGVFSTAVADGFGLVITNCAIINGDHGAGCQSEQPEFSSGFTLVVDVELVSVPDDHGGEDTLIFMSAIEPVITYQLHQVSVIDDPTPIPGYNFTFTPFTLAAIPIDPATTYYYAGFVMNQVGDTATFRIDVDGDHSTAGTLLPTGWTAWVVPEPSTAMLVGLGLAMFSRRRRG